MWGTLGYSLPGEWRVPSYGRVLYVILALLLGCGVIPLGDKVFFRRVAVGDGSPTMPSSVSRWWVSGGETSEED